MRVAVVGSGLSGVFAAHALAARGIDVTIIDVGETLDAKRSAVVAKLKGLPSAQWPKDDYDLIRENATIRDGALPKKMHFGSSYIYAENRQFAPLATLSNGRAPYPTFAKGGFSNIWGAAMLPPTASDMADWPISRTDMEPYFEKIAGLMPLCGGGGTLDLAFPTYKDVLGQLDAGPQGESLLSNLNRAEPALTASGLLYGRARLAIHTKQAAYGVLPCDQSGNCFTGCVRNSIFSAIPMLSGMIDRKQVTYRTGFYVEGVEEDERGATVEGIDLNTGERCNLTFDALFLAGGPIGSTRILLQSRKLYDRTVLLKESQKFIFPMIRLHGAPTTIEHPSVTMASLFLENQVPSLSDHWVHVQVVAMNRLMAEGSGLPGATSAAGLQTWRPLLRRVMAAWCGMHSDHSSNVELRLRRGNASQHNLLELNLRINQSARETARIAAEDLFKKGLKFGTLFCHWMIRFANPGSGTHCGSSFPMRKHPSEEFDSDIYGRPFGWKRIHVVDASVLPSIPGTTLAFPVMANAYRIASTAPIAPQSKQNVPS